MAEIQQTSDITYRVFDYNRLGIDGKPRQLNTDLAIDAIDYRCPNDIEPTAQIVDKTRPNVVKSDYFTVDFINLIGSDQYEVIHKGESFRILMVTEGILTIECENKTHTFTQGTTVLIPTSIHCFSIHGDGKALIVAC